MFSLESWQPWTPVYKSWSGLARLSPVRGDTWIIVNKWTDMRPVYYTPGLSNGQEKLPWHSTVWANFHFNNLLRFWHHSLASVWSRVLVLDAWPGHFLDHCWCQLRCDQYRGYHGTSDKRLEPGPQSSINQCKHFKIGTWAPMSDFLVSHLMSLCGWGWGGDQRMWETLFPWLFVTSMTRRCHLWSPDDHKTPCSDTS